MRAGYGSARLGPRAYVARRVGHGARGVHRDLMGGGA